MSRIYFGTRSLARFEKGSVLTIGAFDGVHCGHQSIIKRLKQKSRELALPAVAVTFYPNPPDFFRPESSPPQIMSWREKALALLDAGVDAVVCLPFNKSIRNMTANQFAQDILSKSMGARFIIVGEDFRFGINREGDFSRLTELGDNFGFAVEKAETYEQHGDRTSSTRIRKLLINGDLEQARELLGRHYEVCGRVTRGHKLGRSLGFPTANVPLKRKRVPLSGVFVVRAKVQDEWLNGVANIGYRPAVNQLKRPLLEVHLLDYEQEIYGERIRVRFEKKLRDECDFADLDALKNAIAQDRDDANAWFENQVI